MPSYCFHSNLQAIIMAGFEPFFCKVNLENYEFDLNNLKSVILKHHKDIAAINFVSVYGQPVDIELMNYIKNKYKVEVVYDAADTFINLNRTVDNANYFICSSFHPTKNLPSNESGLILCRRNQENVFKSIVNFGMDIKKSKKVKINGFNGKFSEYDAVLLLHNLRELKSIKKKLKNNIKFLKKIKNSNIIFPKYLGEKWVSQKFLIRLKTKKKSFEKYKNFYFFDLWSEKPIRKNIRYKNFKKSSSNLNDNKIFQKTLGIILNHNITKLNLIKVKTFLSKI